LAFGQAATQKNDKPAPAAPATVTLPAGWLKPLTWRSIGPANMSGRITSISVYEAEPSIYYVATASGGLLKTVNNGITFEHQFDREATVSLGAVCVSQSNPNLVWVGTGEGNPRNSVSYGDGVYKSTDGGKSWRNMGLKQSFQIGSIVIHPKNPDIVYVGVLGRLYGPHPERGLFKTGDGGKSWDKVLFIDDNSGIIDVQMHPTDPNTLLVAAWERRRDGHDSIVGPGLAEALDRYDPSKKWSSGAGIYKTIDGGKNFKKMTKGLPTNALGRIGLDYFRKYPNIVYAIIDCEKIGMGTPPKKVIAGAYLGISGEDADTGISLSRIADDSPGAKAGLRLGDVVQAIGKKKLGNMQELTQEVRDLKPGDKVTLKVLRGDEIKNIVVTLGKRLEAKGGGGGKFGPNAPKKGRPNYAYLGGQKENIQDEQGPDGFQYGGVYKSTDGGESWTRVNSLNPRPMYFSVVRVDPSDDKYVYVLGVQLYRSQDGGKTLKGDGGKGVHADQHALWINPRNGRHMVVGTDGGVYVSYDRMDNWDHLNHVAMGQFYHVAVCNKRPYWVYGGLQDNGTWGGPSIGLKGGIGPINEDWVFVSGGDGFVCAVDPSDPDLVYFESQDGNIGRRNLRTGQVTRMKPVQKKGDPPHRFNWNTPFLLSRHNPSIFYCAGEFVFRSVKRGDDLRIISPEITHSKRGSGTALAESPKNPDVLWAGTDDGALWITRDGGKGWSNVAAKVALPGSRWVATIEPSRFKEGRAYVAFDAHRSDDDRPYLYVTEDFGQTWQNITANLPAFGSTRCLREDAVKENLLYCGTEFSVFVSIDRGQSWTKLNNNLPTVAVHEIAVHPTAGEIVAATHGRSLWILDVAPLREITADVMKAKVHLYKPKTAVRWHLQPSYGRTNRRFVGDNPPPGAQIYYSLGEPAQKVSLKVLDITGAVVRTLQGPAKAGMNHINWDLSRTPTKLVKGKTKGKMIGKGPGFGGPGAPVLAGAYRLILTVDGVDYAQTLQIEGDPNLLPRAVSEDEDEDDE
jgi:photosystem II stability/assembly factor-like uncharacterized protein